MRAAAWFGVVAAGTLMVTGCGHAPASATPTEVNVPYAASLAYILDQQVGPAFQRATHITYQGRAGEALALVHLIDSKTIPADAFISVGTGPIQDLGPRAPWAISFAAAPLVLAYNPDSRYASQLKAIADGQAPIRSLFQILARPGFRLGRTNPNTDPQGQAFYMMVELAVRLYGLSPNTLQRVLGPLDNPRQVYSEAGILTELQSGNLDASSAFLPEAIEHHLPYIALPPGLNFAVPSDAPLYNQASITIAGGHVIRGAPVTIAVTVVNKSAAGIRFARYLLTHPASWRQDGYQWISPVDSGQTAAIPDALRHLG